MTAHPLNPPKNPPKNPPPPPPNKDARPHPSDQAKYLMAKSNLTTLLREADEESHDYPDNWEAIRLNAGHLRTLRRMLSGDDALIRQQSEDIEKLERALGDKVVAEWWERGKS